MNETVFVQFFNHRIVDKHYETFCLSNGFSTALRYCKEKGDLVWVQTKTYVEGSPNKDLEVVQIPIKKGTIFVSCFFMSQVYQSYIWAKENPNVKIICGGPAIGNFLYNKDDIPKNLFFETKTIEEFFGYQPFSESWNLTLPDLNLKSVFFSYEIEEHCYHGKCIFCNLHQCTQFRTKKNLTFNDLKNSNLPQNFEKRVWIHTPSAKPSFLKNNIEFLPKDNFQYYIFLRTDKVINKTLKNILKNNSNYFSNITFVMGVDFLGNRLLKYMNKGYTMNDVIETIEILNNYNIKSSISMISRWPNILEEDLKEVEYYVNNKEIQNSKAPWVINDLVSKTNTPFLDFVGENIFIGPFLIAKYPYLTKEQEQINNRIEELIKINIEFVYQRNEKNHRPFLF
jgi:radical SAM superfamily enzyme YgiQ (UPF0313 family)